MIPSSYLRSLLTSVKLLLIKGTVNATAHDTSKEPFGKYLLERLFKILIKMLIMVEFQKNGCEQGRSRDFMWKNMRRTFWLCSVFLEQFKLHRYMHLLKFVKWFT